MDGRPWAADFLGMRRQPWQRVPVNTLDPDEYGRVERAWRHAKRSALLLLHRPRSRAARWADRIGVWCLVMEGVLVRRRAAYGRRIRSVPWRWANQAMRDHAGSLPDSTRHLIGGRRPTVVESVWSLPLRPDELPPVLIAHHKHHDRADPPKQPTGTLCIPMRLPLVPPDRTLAGQYRDCVLSQEEHAYYVDRWHNWMTDYPKFKTTEGTAAVHALCMASVRLLRAELLVGRTLASRPHRLLHRAFLELQRLRISMGLTCRQRHAMTGTTQLSALQAT